MLQDAVSMESSETLLERDISVSDFSPQTTLFGFFNGPEKPYFIILIHF